MTQACCKVKNQNGWVTASKDNKTNLRDNYCTVSIVECEWELEQDSLIRVPGAGARLRPRHTRSECVMVRSHSDLITQYSVSQCAGVTGLGDTAMAAFYWSAAAARRARAGNMIIWSVNMINQISTRVKSSSSWEHENTFWFNAWVCSTPVISTLQSAAVREALSGVWLESGSDRKPLKSSCELSSGHEPGGETGVHWPHTTASHQQCCILHENIQTILQMTRSYSNINMFNSSKILYSRVDMLLQINHSGQ